MITPAPKITLARYWNGHDSKYAADLTDEIRVQAAVTVERANRFLDMYSSQTGDFRHRNVNSGWRPKTVNEAIYKALKKPVRTGSNHLFGRAVDIGDEDGSLDEFAESRTGLVALELCGLWLEHPDHTPRWCHVQTVPPRSGNRVFIP